MEKAKNVTFNEVETIMHNIYDGIMLDGAISLEKDIKIYSLNSKSIIPAMMLSGFLSLSFENLQTKPKDGGGFDFVNFPSNIKDQIFVVDCFLSDGKLVDSFLNKLDLIKKEKSTQVIVVAPFANSDAFDIVLKKRKKTNTTIHVYEVFNNKNKISIILPWSAFC